MRSLCALSALPNALRAEAKRSSMGPVVGFFGNDPTDAPARVGLIPGIARYEVDVEMGHRLPGGRAIVDADVVGGGKKLLVQYCPGGCQERHEPGAFFVCDPEEG